LKEMNTPFVSQRTSTRGKTAATLAIAVLGALAVSYLVFSNLPAETEFAFKAPSNQTLQDLYAGWKKQYNVTYGGPEDSVRFKTFTQTYMMIAQVNYRNLSYTLGLNEFSSMTNEEFASVKLGLNAKLFRASGNVTKLPTANLKETVDWTGKGAVQKVKNQGSCGSCWAFSAVGALEGVGAIKGGKLQDFAEQELVDCSRSYGNNGCSGGLMSSAFKYVKDKGLSTQDQYPYKGVDATCKTTTGARFKISGYTDVPANNAAQLKAAIAKGPVSVAVQADATVFRNYKTGVVTGTACGTNLNHGVLAVGYETSGTPYYKVKNSWGTTWGDQGYIKIGITDGAGVCGIQKMSSYPLA
jgi:C1A family cysteine protease